jgi:hypothetical protein
MVQARNHHEMTKVYPSPEPSRENAGYGNLLLSGHWICSHLMLLEKLRWHILRELAELDQ